MDCKDLMVGDWVSYKDDPPYIVRGTSICEVVTIDNGIDHRNVMDDAINPIPLTEDILEKNGYKSTPGLDFYWLDDKKHCCIKKYDGKRLFCYKQGINDIWLVVKYVHQLQHLLRLIGVQKEIKL